MKPLLDVEVERWTQIFSELGVKASMSVVIARAIGDLYTRLMETYPNSELQPRQVFRAAVSGILENAMPYFSPERVQDRVMALGSFDMEQLPGVVQQELGSVLTGSASLVERLEQALLARERMSEEMGVVLAQTQVMLIQQHQVLRGHYPFMGETISTELLGTRLVQEQLGDDLLPKIYRGLDEIVRALRSTGNWLGNWDKNLTSPMGLRQTQDLFAKITPVVGVLEEKEYSALKRLYRLKWEELDGRVLAALEDKFSWKPLV